jgi:iron only hydrogenase large subunit-like protein
MTCKPFIFMTYNPRFCGVKMTEELKLLGTVGGGSGGYLEFIYKIAARELFGVTSVDIKYKPTRNQDLRVAVLEIDGKPMLTFATAYGFKNIQNIMRKMKQGKEREYDFVEIMACPSGCLNGGGQLRPEKGKNAKELLKEVEAIYQDVQASSPEENEKVKEMYKVWLSGVYAPETKTKLHTQYHAREKINLNPLLIKW